MSSIDLTLATSAPATGRTADVRVVGAEITAARSTSTRGTQDDSPAEVAVGARENACRQVVDLAAGDLREEVPDAVAATRVMVDEDDAERTSTITFAARASRHRPTSCDTESSGRSGAPLSVPRRQGTPYVRFRTDVRGRNLAGHHHSVPASAWSYGKGATAGAGMDPFAASGCNVEQTEHARQPLEPGLVAHAGSKSAAPPPGRRLPTPSLCFAADGGVGLLEIDTVSTRNGRDGL